jgi:hypothetical protein
MSLCTKEKRYEGNVFSVQNDNNSKATKSFFLLNQTTKTTKSVFCLVSKRQNNQGAQTDRSKFCAKRGENMRTCQKKRKHVCYSPSSSNVLHRVSCTEGERYVRATSFFFKKQQQKGLFFLV